MANKLRSVFNTNPPVESFKVIFESKEALDSAQKALKEIEAGQTFVGKKLSGISGLIRQTSVGDDIYSFPEEGEVTETIVGPAFDSFKFQVIIDGVQEELVFKRFMGNENTLVEYSDNPIFTLRLQVSNSNIRESKIEVRVYREKAKDAKDFCRAYCELVGILETIYSNVDKNEELKQFIHIRNYWKRALKIEEVFGVTFDIQDLKESNVLNVNRLSLLVVDKLVISRPQNVFYQYFDASEWEKVKTVLDVGKMVRANWNDDREIVIYGQTIYLTVNCTIPKAIIEEVVYEDDGVRIKCGPVEESMEIIEFVHDESEMLDCDDIVQSAIDFNKACDDRYYS